MRCFIIKDPAYLPKGSPPLYGKLGVQTGPRKIKSDLINLQLMGDINLEVDIKWLEPWTYRGDFRDFNRYECESLQGLASLYSLRLSGAFGYESMIKAQRENAGKTVENCRQNIATLEYESGLITEYLWLKGAVDFNLWEEVVTQKAEQAKRREEFFSRPWDGSLKISGTQLNLFNL